MSVNNKNNTKNIGVILIVLVCLLAGMAFIGWGAALSAKEGYTQYSLMLVTFGGTFFGVVATLTLSYVRHLDILTVLRETLESKILSPPDRVHELKKLYHKYHLTETKNGWKWKYSSIDFSSSIQVGSLNSVILDQDEEGHPYPGLIEAGARDERLVIFQKPCSGEPTIIYVFPYVGKGISRKHAGIAFMESWLVNPIVSKVLLTTEPINKHIIMGVIPDATAKECEKIWKENFKSDISFLSKTAEHFNANK